MTTLPTPRVVVLHERLHIATDRAIKNVGTLSPISFVKTFRRKLAVLVANNVHENVENGRTLKTIIAQRICPHKWIMNADGIQCAACVESVAYDLIKKQMRIKLVDRDDGVMAADAAGRMWEELGPMYLPVSPGNVKTTVQNIEIVSSDSLLADLVTTIARLVIAYATVRSDIVTARVYRFSNEMRKEAGLPTTDDTPTDPKTPAIDYIPEYIVAVGGLSIVGPHALDPARWSNVLPAAICNTLESLVRIDEMEHRTAITMDTIKELHAFYQQTHPTKLLSETLDDSDVSEPNHSKQTKH